MTCLGLDFDNTVVDYDALFARVARTLDTNAPTERRALRTWLRARSGGEEQWQEVQGVVYGALMAEAVPTAGFVDFLARVQNRGISIRIISHKTRFPARGPRIDLCEVAREWLERHGFLDANRWFFEPSRTEKLRRIAQQGCTHFVDDLEEVLVDPDFPPGVVRLLYTPSGSSPAGVHVCPTWDAVFSNL